jgi:hypothetical protein
MIDISLLDEKELRGLCPYISILEGQKMDIETIGYGLSLELQGMGMLNSADKKIQERYAELRLKPRDYWAEVKKELYILLCTKDKKYADLRSRFSKDSGPATTTFVGMLSATIATQLGAVEGVVTPLIALLLYGMIKLGLNSWCNLQKPLFEGKHGKQQ